MLQEKVTVEGDGSVCIQHIVFPADQRTVPVYLRAESLDPHSKLTPQNAPRWERRSILVHEGTAVSLDAVFNQLPEAYWLAYTEAKGFRFNAVVSGVGELQVWRRQKSGGDEMVCSQGFDTPAANAKAAALIVEVPAPFDRIAGAGLLYIKIGARRGPVILISGDWFALGVSPTPVKLVAGYCTFKREEQVFDNVRKVLEAPEIRDVLARLVVVDQGGSSELADKLAALAKMPGGDVLSPIQQDNFGGAGGFTRVMLEALGTEHATHVLLMDDDAVIETESIFRTASFLSLTQDLAVGGQMLDLLFPDQVTETGARVLADKLHWESERAPEGTPRNAVLTDFASVAHTDYNAWWYFAVPLSVVRAQGLPLPLFIRCDDIEYGLRLARNGIRTVTLPGVGVWHDPFYLKDSAMLSFYERRNKFIVLSMHYDIPSKRFAENFLVSAMRHLLAYRYDAAALDYAGVVEWLRGPQAIVEHPRANQAWISMAGRLQKQRTIPLANTVAAVSDSQTLEQLTALTRPLRGFAFWRTGLQVMVRGLFGHRTRPADVAVPALPKVLRRWNIWWVQQAYSEVAFRRDPILVRATGEDSCIALTHSAPAFRWLLPRILLAYARLRWQARTCAAQWRSAAGDFHTEAFWRGYLGMGEPSTPPHLVQAKQQALPAVVADSIVPAMPSGVDLNYAGELAGQS